MSAFAELLSSESTSTAPVQYLPEVVEIFDEIVTNRRWFHAHPELSFEEVQTAAKIVEILRSYGIEEIFEGVGRTGVVALIRGASEGPCVALRADIDALPVLETAKVEYVSQNSGVMHACGHDGHIAGLLAAAKVLWGQRQTLRGCVKLLFQPAEEGYGGAREMIKEGVLEEGNLGPRVDSVYGIHLWSFLGLGNIGCQEGPIMAASDKFVITVKGKGGHGAAPQGTVDAIVEAAAVVTSLQTIVSRNKDPLDSGVVTCGMIKGGYGYNIIADKVEITGTSRSFTPQTQALIKERMGCICCGVAQTYGGEIDLEYVHGYPPTVNAYPECNRVVTTAAAKIVGPERASQPQKTMGAEDFSYFLEARKGCFLFVGAALPGETRPHHKSVFDFDERALMVSASVFIQIIRDLLG
ncbi:peptidase, M20D family [Ochromonadaceae sp. CCMP2298]|nr:peptidase, M20D family [Ochromonadaceae sp. CCMP2298]